MTVKPILSIGHTGITVSDLARSIGFYREILGLQISEPVRCAGEMFEQLTGVPGAVIDVCFVSAPGHVIELLCYRKPEGLRPSALRSCDPGFWHLALKVGDIDAVVAAAARAQFMGLSPVKTVSEGPLKGLRVVYVRDPDGVALELIQEPNGVALEQLYLQAAH